MSGAKLQAALTPQTKCLILCSPSNPTGAVYTRQQLQQLVDVLSNRPDIWVLSDEIYEHLLYDDSQHISIATFPGMQERTIIING